MLRMFNLIKDPIDFRIINLLNVKRFSAEDLQEILCIPIEEIRCHLKKLYELGIINCDLTSPVNMCRISKSFIDESSLFYQLAIAQMKKAPVYQNDLIRIKGLVQE